MKLLTSDFLHYKVGNGLASGATCWVRLYVGPGQGAPKAVAVVTELNTNTGMSVTNGAEAIRAAIGDLLRSYGYTLGTLDLAVYEHYNDLISYGRPALDRRFAGDRYALQHYDGSFAAADLGDVLRALGPAGLVDLPDWVVLDCREKSLS